MARKRIAAAVLALALGWLRQAKAVVRGLE